MSNLADDCVVPGSDSRLCTLLTGGVRHPCPSFADTQTSIILSALVLHTQHGLFLFHMGMQHQCDSIGCAVRSTGVTGIWVAKAMTVDGDERPRPCTEGTTLGLHDKRALVLHKPQRAHTDMNMPSCCDGLQSMLTWVRSSGPACSAAPPCPAAVHGHQGLHASPTCGGGGRETLLLMGCHA